MAAPEQLDEIIADAFTQAAQTVKTTDLRARVDTRVVAQRHRARRRAGLAMLTALAVVALAGGVAVAGRGSHPTQVEVTNTGPSDGSDTPATTVAPTITVPPTVTTPPTITIPAPTTRPPSTAPVASETEIIKVRPVTAAGHLASGFEVTQTVPSDAADPTDCSGGSEYVGQAYRCFSSNGVNDPCWKDTTDPATPAVVCMDNATTTSVTRLLLDQPAPAADGSPSTTADSPWAVQLSSGDMCNLLGGAHDSFGENVIDYSCPGQLRLLRGVDRSTSQWTFKTAVSQPGGTYAAGPDVTATRAWYGLPSTG